MMHAPRRMLRTTFDDMEFLPGKNWEVLRQPGCLGVEILGFA